MHRTSTHRLTAEIAARTERERWTRLAAEPRYTPYEATHVAGWRIMDRHVGEPVEACRTESGARYAARLLNTGCAVIDRHATLGTRVVTID